MVRVDLPLVPRLVAACEAPHGDVDGFIARRAEGLPQREVQGEPRKHPVAEVGRFGENGDPHVPIQAGLEVAHQPCRSQIGITRISRANRPRIRRQVEKGRREHARNN